MCLNLRNIGLMPGLFDPIDNWIIHNFNFHLFHVVQVEAHRLLLNFNLVFILFNQVLLIWIHITKPVLLLFLGNRRELRALFFRDTTSHSLVKVLGSLKCRFDWSLFNFLKTLLLGSQGLYALVTRHPMIIKSISIFLNSLQGQLRFGTHGRIPWANVLLNDLLNILPLLPLHALILHVIVYFSNLPPIKLGLLLMLGVLHFWLLMRGSLPALRERLVIALSFAGLALSFGVVLKVRRGVRRDSCGFAVRWAPHLLPWINSFLGATQMLLLHHSGRSHPPWWWSYLLPPLGLHLLYKAESEVPAGTRSHRQILPSLIRVFSSPRPHHQWSIYSSWRIQMLVDVTLGGNFIRIVPGLPRVELSLGQIRRLATESALIIVIRQNILVVLLAIQCLIESDLHASHWRRDPIATASSIRWHIHHTVWQHWEPRLLALACLIFRNGLHIHHFILHKNVLFCSNNRCRSNHTINAMFLHHYHSTADILAATASIGLIPPKYLILNQGVIKGAMVSGALFGRCVGGTHLMISIQKTHSIG